MTRNEHVIPPDDDEGDENSSVAFTHPVYPRILRAQWAWLVQMTDQNCADAMQSIVFYKSLPKEAREFATQAKPETLEFLRGLREEEVKGLKAYLLLRSTGSYLAWGIAAFVGALTGALVLYNAIKTYLKG